MTQFTLVMVHFKGRYMLTKLKHFESLFSRGFSRLFEILFYAHPKTSVFGTGFLENENAVLIQIFEVSF